MSNKQWTVKYRHHAERGKSGKKYGTKFPRHCMNDFEGTHMGMRKRLWSKSNPGSIWKHGPALKPKYIIGLLSKYVGKTYEEFKFAYDMKMKKFKKYDLHWYKLEDFLHDEPKDCYWKQEFYIDNEGFIRKCKLIPRTKIYGPTLNKKQKQFNERVKVPDLGICRNDAHHPVLKTYSYCEENSWDFKKYHTKMNPICLGVFWVVLNKKILKLPIYTCAQDSFREYYNYRSDHYDYKLHKYINVPFEKDAQSVICSDKYKILKKRQNLVNNWIPIHSYIPLSLRGQDHWVSLPNVDITDSKQRIFTMMRNLENNSPMIDKEYITKELEKEKKKLESLPETRWYNMGYGKFYLFVKRCDYESYLRGYRTQNET